MDEFLSSLRQSYSLSQKEIDVVDDSAKLPKSAYMRHTFKKSLISRWNLDTLNCEILKVVHEAGRRETLNPAFEGCGNSVAGNY
jgi:hypothetical protein